MKHVKLFEEHINERLIGQGTQHMVYDLGKDRVKKVGPDTQEQAKYFKKFPNEFPRVYSFSKEDMSLEIEKLDVRVINQYKFNGWSTIRNHREDELYLAPKNVYDNHTHFEYIFEPK